MKNIQKLKVAVFAIFVAAVGAAHASSQETDAVWLRHLAAWDARDLDGIVADYADDAIVLIRDKAYFGHTGIRAAFIKLFRIFDAVDEFKIDSPFIRGKVVYFTWRARRGRDEFPVGTDTFFIERGRIAYQTITADEAFFAGE